MEIIFYIKNVIRKILSPIFLRIKNKKNKTFIEEAYFSLNHNFHKGVMLRKGSEITPETTLDKYSYISGPRSFVDGAIIGKYCSIARQVTIGIKGHNYNWVTTSPIITSPMYGFIDNNIDEPQKDNVIIGNDVWIGMNVMIMRGIKIGDGAVVAAGSIVTKDVEPYSIVGGNPARHIKYRFSQDIIKKLLSIKWWDWEESTIKERINDFYDINKFVDKYYK